MYPALRAVVELVYYSLSVFMILVPLFSQWWSLVLCGYWLQRGCTTPTISIDDPWG